ncbi:hypothetical protein [Rhodococcoides yunnanense]|uniref:Uncharacterized protein n=1 Tax=Rhodococcoides yunnanense TaxID=278209 RepID=A0ABU4BJT6_9NOCA|nr:hypothetical protein [Rhodococcus yunnanensis]MDV6264435.1 hypothetical protein [Rhodococcus yunnanensis]
MEDTSDRGIKAFIRTVAQRGGRAERLTTSRRNPVQVWSMDGKSSCIVRVRSKVTGDWKARRQDESLESDDTGSSYWVFVDLANEEPRFYMVSSEEMATDIRGEVDLWVQDSPLRTRTGHHAIAVDRVAHGSERWDLLGLSSTLDTTLDVGPEQTWVRTPRVKVPRKSAKAAVEEEVVDNRVRVVADCEGYRLSGRYDPETQRLEITAGPMEGRRFDNPSVAASAVATHISGDVEERDGWQFWQLDTPDRAPLGSFH